MRAHGAPGPRWYRLVRLALLVGGMGLSAAPCALAERVDSGNCSLPCPVGADLHFRVQIDKYLFFGIGGTAWPGTGGAIPETTFAVRLSIPPTAAVPADGNGVPVDWSGAAPGFAVVDANNALPVQVRSNAGQVEIKASLATSLTSSSGSRIAVSAIDIVSDDSTNLPAPPLVESGEGAAVAVSGTGHGGLVTERDAVWTFHYTHDPATPAGNYAGRITFTAAVP